MALSLLLLLPLASASRIQRSDLSALARSTHALGFELEHDLSQRWAVTPPEAIALRGMVDSLHGGESDLAWNWSFVPQGWLFPAVKVSEPKPNKGLAYHMLHRHGLAPMMASKFGEEFQEFLKGRNLSKEDGLEKAEGLAAALEDFGPVKELFEGLSGSVSLSALRNLHAFDHEWALEGCRTEMDECPLQAAFSEKAHELMVSGGFTEAVCTLAQERYVKLWQFLDWRKLVQMGMDPMNAGASKTIYDLHIKGAQLHGRIHWEGSGTSHRLTLPTKLFQQWQEGMSFRSSEEAMEAYVESVLAEEVEKHHSWFQARRLHFWAGEDAEFTEMYFQRGARPLH